MCIRDRVERVALPLDQRRGHLQRQANLALFLLAIPLRHQRLDKEAAVADGEIGVARRGGKSVDVGGLQRLSLIHISEPTRPY